MAPMRTAAFGNVVTWPPLLEKIFREFAKLAAKLESTPVIKTSTASAWRSGDGIRVLTAILSHTTAKRDRLEGVPLIRPSGCGSDFVKVLNERAHRAVYSW